MILAITPTAGAVVDGDDVTGADGWDRAAVALPDGEADGGGEVDLADTPEHLASLVTAGPAVAGWLRHDGTPLALPVEWDPDTTTATVPTALLETCGAAAVSKASVTFDTWTGFGPSGKQGLMLRGRGEAIVDGATTSLALACQPGHLLGRHRDRHHRAGPRSAMTDTATHVPDEAHRRPTGADDAVVAAVGKVSEALEWIERVRGRLYDFHQMMGRADFLFGDAADALEEAGRPEEAAMLRNDVVGRNVLNGRWTSQMVEEFEDCYYQPVRETERVVRDRLMDGKRHVFEAELKEQRRTAGHPRHTSRPD